MNERFRTVVEPPECPNKISHDDTLLVTGSCFTENIGRYLQDFRFPAQINPTGVLYNPLSISMMLSRAIDGEPFCKEDLFQHDGLWRSFDHDSTFARHTIDETLAAIQESTGKAKAAVENMSFLFITFGTSFVYEHKGRQRIVANCHKLPHENFERRLLDIEDICTAMGEILRRLRKSRPLLKVLLTVSPVRHLRDDPHENQVSKSRLHCAVHELEKAFPEIYYFPAFELLMDDLRDYRFYGTDMIHPNETAIAYIWQKFMRACITPDSISFIRTFEPVLRARGHRLGNPGLAVSFAERNLLLLRELASRWPRIDLSDDLRYFSSLSRAP